ncbi:MAG: Holliday junction branch migration protein RuvA [Acidimicrobiia bacterium]|nr:Holliday junction branch migration protein RuvA [Acidimicrobiia bacterium]MDQ3500209.1 Holliday junction branch migration protein RuvA [Actinomycetota bacterium]
MIGRLRGTLVARSEQSVTLDVAGVGYEVLTSPRTQGLLPGIGEDLVIHTHLNVREDSLTLYGFVSEGERNLFRVLITASGVGPKVGLAILGALSVTEIRRAVATEDVDALTVVPGVGRRLAQKMVLELKPKLDEQEAEVIGGSGTAAQLRQALEGLGYTPAEVREAAAAADTEMPMAEQIRAALQLLGRR